MSNLYAFQKTKPNLNAAVAKMRIVFAILFISGYVPLPRRRMYWEHGSYTFNIAISEAISVNRFEDILAHLHCADNAKLIANDKLAKMRSLFDMMNTQFTAHWPVEQDIDVDEAILAYYGRQSAKQFRRKPIRWGYKVWCLNTRLGYLIHFDPYTGRSSYDPVLDLGSFIDLQLIDPLPDLAYRLYSDNYFTSLHLLGELRKRNIVATGTISKATNRD
ncbi:UNVERIFIED_CONTAM: hypothetical protein FKN15_014528 [Acipenser sinensis]